MSTKKYAYVNNEILVWARNTTPFSSTRDVQERTCIDSTKIDSWERGEDYPSINEAKKLANLYKIPFATFFLSAIPSFDPVPYTDRRTKKDSMYGPESYALWSEIKRIIGNRDSLMELVDDEDTETYDSLPVVGITTTVEDIADAIRLFLNVTLPFKNKTAYGNSSYKYYRRLIEKKGIMVCQITGVSLEEMKGISIYYDRYPVIGINSKDYDRAKAFTLFHELAHLVRRSSSLCLIDFDERNDDEEKTCDAIAAAVMMPKDSFVSIVSLALNKYDSYTSDCLTYIADRFGVSIFAVIRRLYETSIIGKVEYSSLYEECSREFEEKQTDIDYYNSQKELRIPFHTRYINKEGFLYTRVLMDSYSRGNISLGELCNILDVKRSHIDNIERAVMNL